MTRTERGLKLYDLALAVLRAKGTPKSISSVEVTVYSKGLLTIRHWPSKGNLDAWYGPRVLTVEQWGGVPHVSSYTPGDWERELEAAAEDDV